jgi:cellobiose-specific phosphotransferase system component IIC
MKANTLRNTRPRWSLKSSFYTALVILILVTPLVLLTVQKSIWTELEMITGIISAMMFIYLAVILYQGVRFDKNERIIIDWPKESPIRLSDAGSYVTGDFGGFFTELGSEAGIPGLIIGFILDIFATFIIVFLISLLLWIGLNGIEAVLAVSIPLYFFYRRALRAIVIRGRRCRGNIVASLLQALKSTLGYAVWFYGIFMLAHYVEHIRLT